MSTTIPWILKRVDKFSVINKKFIRIIKNCIIFPLNTFSSRNNQVWSMVKSNDEILTRMAPMATKSTIATFSSFITITTVDVVVDTNKWRNFAKCEVWHILVAIEITKKTFEFRNFWIFSFLCVSS